MIYINGIVKNYKRKIALNNVSFNLMENQILGLVGPNGAGKSTLMRIITEINDPSSGKIIREYNISISVVFDYNGLYPQLSAKENLLFFYRLKRKENVNDVKIVEDTLKKMNLYNERNLKVKSFSKGMLRKLAIARAIISEPNILVLDEPFDGLDVESHTYVIKFLKDWVKRKKRAIILSSHNMSDVENICTDIIILNNGQIHLQANLEELKRKEYIRTKIYFLEKCSKNVIDKIMASCNCTNYFLQDNELIVEAGIDIINLSLKKFLNIDYAISNIIQEQNTLEEVYINVICGGNDRE